MRVKDITVALMMKDVILMLSRTAGDEEDVERIDCNGNDDV